MIGVREVADWFLSHSGMEHKKLQKLCYYAQAWHCALEGEPLFTERIEAWVHGPVIPELYSKYRGYGWQIIPQVNGFDESKLSSQAQEVLRAVYETYGGLTGMQLETLTHSESPWQRARGGLYPDYPLATCTNPISIEDMKSQHTLIISHQRT